MKNVAFVPSKRLQRSIWPEVRELGFAAIKKQWQVGMAVAPGNEPMQILEQYGEF